MMGEALCIIGTRDERAGLQKIKPSQHFRDLLVTLAKRAKSLKKGMELNVR